MSGSLADRIDALLPQTQCGKCGYSGCRPYADAIVRGEADINQCPPGGQAGVDALAVLLGRPGKPLDRSRGEEKPTPEVAVIIEAECIGCTRCIQACPVDAIVGAAKQMHTVIESECTGCELCLAPCPVDCIEMIPIAAVDARESQRRRNLARSRYVARNSRLDRERREREQARRVRRPRTTVRRDDERADPMRNKRDVIAAAIARARQRHPNAVPVAQPPRGERPPAIAAAIARARAAQQHENEPE